MRSYIILIIFIFILCILYFIYRNNQYNKILESFNNIENIDNDTITNNRVKNNTKINNWNGIWSYKDNLYAQFMQNNDKIIISFSNTIINAYNLKNIFSKTNLNNIKSDTFCLPNLFLGIGTLNNDKNVFNLTEIYCSNYINNSLNLTVNNLSGKIENNIITLYSNLNNINYNSPLILNKIKNFSYNHVYKFDKKYVKHISNFVNLFPEIPDSEIDSDLDFCKKYNINGVTNIVKCMDNNSGLQETTFNGTKINACGITNGVDNNCIGTPKCLIFPSNGIDQCDLTFNNLNLNQYNNFMQMNALIDHNKNNLKICNYLKDFVNGKLNSCILCYVTNLSDVKTLDYQFFGVDNNENNIILQDDYMKEYLNKNILKKYRDNINLSDLQINDDNLVKAFSFTNLIEYNNDSGTLRLQIEKNLGKIKNLININKNTTNYNSKLLPSVWQINYDKNLTLSKENVLVNSCSFTLSTLLKYNKQVKYVEMNNDKVLFSLFPNGINKKLMFQNVKIISESKEYSAIKFITFTANIKGNNDLYLLPSDYKEGIVNNSTGITMKKKNEVNGKWFVLGFNLSDLEQIKLILDQIIL
jgi:hypothetical protein